MNEARVDYDSEWWGSESESESYGVQVTERHCESHLPFKSGPGEDLLITQFMSLGLWDTTKATLKQMAVCNFLVILKQKIFKNKNK